MSEIFELADSYIDDLARLDPVYATFEGIPDHNDQLTDYSPNGFAQRADMTRRYLQRVKAVDTESHRDFLTREVMLERLHIELDSYDNNDYLRDMSFAWSPAQAIRSVFDQMRFESNDDWEHALDRLEAIPRALEGIKETLRLGMSKQMWVSRRQVIACARQARIWAGTDVESKPFFELILDEHPNAKIKSRLSDKLASASSTAGASYDEFSTFLLDEYCPKTNDSDGVGRDRYLRAADMYLGMRIDPDETYAWGWDELARLNTEIVAICAQIKPNATLNEIVEQLNDDHERWIHGQEALVEWLGGFLERSTKELNGTTFDIPEPLQRLEVRIAPPGGPANQYYVPPSEDLKRAGTYWYPTDGRSRFPIWTEISTAYHEGVPGHHLQCGTVKVLRNELSRFQRNLFISGHGEGWALYAERLMDEVGFYERPEYKLDMLLSQYFRAARVVVDLGLHLGYKDQNNVVWTAEAAHAFMREHSNLTDSYIASEIVRYLGIPAQAISYKVGERVWLEAREQARHNDGARFDLREWHNRVLALGPLGLDQLRQNAC